MKQETYTVTGMHCQSCVKLIELLLKNMPGIQSCSVDLWSETVTLVYDAAHISLDQLNKQLQETDYQIV